MSLAPPTVSKLPAGLLGYLQIKNGGRNPEQLATFLQPTLDLWPLYLALDRRTTSTAFNIASVNTQSVVPVTEGQAWWIIQVIAITPVLTAGQTVRLAPTMLRGGITNLIGEFSAAVAGEQAYGTLELNQPTILVPGDSVGVATASLAAGPINACDLRVTYVPMPF